MMTSLGEKEKKITDDLIDALSFDFNYYDFQNNGF